MTLHARLEAPDRSADRRWDPRQVLRLPLPGALAERPGFDVVVHDLSRNGLLIETSAELTPGTQLEVELPETGLALAVVMWRRGQQHGCRFDAPISSATLSAARLLDPIAPRDQVQRQEFSATALDERLPLPSRMRWIVGLAAAGWLLVIAPFAIL